MSGVTAHLRALDVSGLVAPDRKASGKPPRLEWLPLAALRVDDTFQREITAGGRKNIQTIAANFNWAAFSTVIVAPLPKGLYSIVDGQHRCTAALLLGLEKVPCQIVDAAAAEQARAFEQINANLTRVRTETRFHALAVAGDPVAADIVAMAREAGVSINRYPISAANAKPGQTGLCWHLGKFAQSHGRKAVVLALRAIATTGHAASIYPHNAGLLKFELVSGTARAFAARMSWGEDILLKAFGSFDLGHVGTSVAGGQYSRANAAHDSIARRLDRWAQANGVQAAPRAPRACVPSTQRNGVSLARVPSLERGGA